MNKKITKLNKKSENIMGAFSKMLVGLEEINNQYDEITSEIVTEREKLNIQINQIKSEKDKNLVAIKKLKEFFK